MRNNNLSSNILGSQYFEQLMISEEVINKTLNAIDLNAKFEPDSKYFEQKKNVEESLLETMEQIQEPILSLNHFKEILENLTIIYENQELHFDYHFNSIFYTMYQQLMIAKDFVSREMECKVAIELYEKNIDQYDCKEIWIGKYRDLFETIIEEEKDQRFEYIRDHKSYTITKLKVLLSEDMLKHRQKFKCKYVQLSKELNKKYGNHNVKGAKYFDDY